MYGLCLDLDVPTALAGGNTTIWGGSAEALGDACSRGYVVISTDAYKAFASGSGGGVPQFTAQEVAALKYQAANPSPFNLSTEDGYLVAGSVLGVWVVAWCAKALVLALRSDGLSQSE